MCDPTTQPTVKPLPTVPDYGAYAIDVHNLTFGYSTNPDLSTLNVKTNRKVLTNLNLKLATGSRCLLIGANGAGTSVFTQQAIG
jgi:ABC-type multidrug transport system ATPase subunit